MPPERTAELERVASKERTVTHERQCESIGSKMSAAEKRVNRLRRRAAYVNVLLTMIGDPRRNDTIDRWFYECEEHRIHLFGKDEKEKTK
jgi:hypothetical protein